MALFECHDVHYAYQGRVPAVVGLDLNPEITRLHARRDFLGLHCDLTDETALVAALGQAVRTFGGIDLLVLNDEVFRNPGEKTREEKLTWLKQFAKLA